MDRLRVVLVVLFVVVASNAHTQSFRDANFETPPVTPGSFIVEPNNSSWLFKGATGDSGVANGSGVWGQEAASGQQYAFIQRDASISQTVYGLIPGEQYQLKFAMARRNGSVGGNDANRIEIDRDNVALNVVRAVDEKWRTYISTVFTATAPSATFTFKGLIVSDDATTLIDAVSIGKSLKTADILQNGGFEVPNFGKSGWNYETNYLEGGGWCFSSPINGSGNAGIASENSPWGKSAFEGHQFAFVQRGGVISQTLQNLVVGKSYYLTFEDSIRTDFGSHGLRITVDGKSYIKYPFQIFQVGFAPDITFHCYRTIYDVPF